MPWYDNECEEAKKLMRKARKQFNYVLKLFDTLATSISECGIELWGFKGFEKLGKTNLHVQIHGSQFQIRLLKVYHYVLKSLIFLT